MKSYGHKDNSFSALIVEIHVAFKQIQASGIRASISENARWHTPKKDNNKYWIKKICWDLINIHHRGLSQPDFCFVHGGLDEKDLEKALSKAFPKKMVVIEVEHKPILKNKK